MTKTKEERKDFFNLEKHLDEYVYDWKHHEEEVYGDVL